MEILTTTMVFLMIIVIGMFYSKLGRFIGKIIELFFKSLKK